MRPNVLITGGAGYQGLVVAELLHDRGYPVTLFDCFRYGEDPVFHLARQGVRIIRGDVTRADEVARAVKDHDVVIHLAALVGYPLCEKEPVTAEEVNVGGTRHVVAAMSPRQSLIFASTGSVYGRVDSECTEQTPTRPLSLYGRTKLEAEKIVLDFGGVALRFASLFGVSPCMRFDLLANAFVYRAVHEGRLLVYGAENRRTFLHVQDAALSHLAAVENYDLMRGEAFNVGDESLNCTKRHLAQQTARQFPMEITIAESGEDPDLRDYAVRYEKIQQLIGFSASVDLPSGIEEVGKLARFCAMKAAWRFSP